MWESLNEEVHPVPPPPLSAQYLLKFSEWKFHQSSSGGQLYRHFSISNLAFSHFFESRQTNRRACRMAVLEFQSFVYTNWIFESQIKCSIKPGELIKVANRE